MHPMGKGKIGLELANIKFNIIQCLLVLGSDLQVVHGDPLRLEYKQYLPHRKALEFCLIF